MSTRSARRASRSTRGEAPPPPPALWVHVMFGVLLGLLLAITVRVLLGDLPRAPASAHRHGAPHAE